MKVINKEEGYKNAAIAIYKKAQELLLNQETIVLAIPGGRSVEGVFKELLATDIDFNKIHVFMIFNFHKRSLKG